MRLLFSVPLHHICLQHCLSAFIHYTRFPFPDLAAYSYFAPWYQIHAIGLSPPSSHGLYLVQSKILEAKDIELAPPGPGEVQIAVRSSTLCGSDLHYYNHYRNGSITIKSHCALVTSLRVKL